MRNTFRDMMRPERVYNRCRFARPCVQAVLGGDDGEDENELEKQICPRSTHCSCHDVADLCSSEGRGLKRRGLGAVPPDRRSLGDLRTPLREAEIEFSNNL